MDSPAHVRRSETPTLIRDKTLDTEIIADLVGEMWTLRCTCRDGETRRLEPINRNADGGCQHGFHVDHFPQHSQSIRQPCQHRQRCECVHVGQLTGIGSGINLAVTRTESEESEESDMPLLVVRCLIRPCGKTPIYALLIYRSPKLRPTHDPLLIQASPLLVAC